MKKRLKLFFAGLVLTFIALNTTSYLYANQTITISEKRDKDDNIILVDEDGNIYTKNEKTEVIKTTNKDGDEVLVDNEDNTYIREEKAEKHSKLLKFILLAGISLILTFIAIVVFY